MKIDSIIWAVLPLLALAIVTATVKLQPIGETSKKSVAASIVVGATILSVYIFLRYVIFPPNTLA